jgi:hypothetical protein
MSVAKHKKYKYLSFVTPSGAALCLSVAIEAAARAEGIRPGLLLTPLTTWEGNRGFQIREESINDLYYFFEQSIVSVTMSFQAVEVFANAIIGRRTTKNIVVKRRTGDKDLTPTQAERELSTEEKIGQILPDILGVACPRRNRVWQYFKMLKVGRDDTVHLKSRDIYTRNNVERESLFFSYLNRDVRKFPDAAVRVMSYFFPKQDTVPRWLRYAREKAEHDSWFGVGNPTL